MFKVFKRKWWRNNPSYPNGLEPCVGRKTYLTTVQTESEARQYCRDYNTSHNPGRFSIKAEYESL